jgi:hypothetical protein
MSIPQVQGVTGHKTLEQTGNYNHLTAGQITDVMKAQRVIAGIKEPEKENPSENTGEATNSQMDLTLVKMPDQKTA